MKEETKQQIVFKKKKPASAMMLIWPQGFYRDFSTCPNSDSFPNFPSAVFPLYLFFFCFVYYVSELLYLKT